MKNTFPDNQAPVSPGDFMPQSQQIEEDTIDLVELFYLFWDHLLQIILMLILGGAIAFAVTRFAITPRYTATAQIYVVSASNDSVVNLADLQIGAQLTNDYQKLLKIHGLIDEVNANLGLNMSYSQIANMIEITNPSNTRLLYITVESPSATMSANIANEVARLSTEYLPIIMECEPPNIADPALVPTSPSSPNYSTNIVIGAVAFAALYCTFLLIRMLSNDTFVTQDDIEKYLGEPPLGMIPEGELGSFNKKRRRTSKQNAEAVKKQS